MRKITYPSLSEMISDLKEEGVKTVRVSAKRTFNNKSQIPSVNLQVIVTTFVGNEVGELLIPAGRSFSTMENKVPKEILKKADATLEEARKRLQDAGFTVKPGIITEEEILGALD